MLEEGCCLWRLALAIRKIGCCGDDHPLCYYAASMTTEACELIEIIRIPSPLLSIEQLIRFQELVPKILHTAGQLRRDALLHYAANLVE